MDNILDIFKADAFSAMELTARANRMPFVPSRVARLGIFEEKPVTTTVIGVESLNNTLGLIPNTPRGGPATQLRVGRREVRNFNVPHLPLEADILAQEIQNIRAFGSSTQLETIQTMVDDRVKQMLARHDATLEYGRLGALKGIILDSDGTTVIANLFTEFGLTQIQVDFTLGTSTTNIKGKIIEVVRGIESELGMATYTGIHCFCGDTFFDRLVAHPDVRSAWDKWQEGAALRADNRAGFMFAGVMFENYRGNVGGVPFVAASEAHFFPLGVPELFTTAFAPANTVDFANTPGLPRYVIQEPMPKRRGISVLTESNPLSLCSRPRVLVRGTTSN